MSEINFEALEDRVVIKIVEEEKTTISGIILSKDIKNNTRSEEHTSELQSH